MSVSGIHFGHYIGACDSEMLSNLHATFLDLVISTGSIVTRWVKGLSVMLEKIKGNIQVEKLRTILLMEADYNFLNKLLIGIRLMRRLEGENRFPADLGGSRKEHDAIDIALGRKLTSNIMRQLQRTGTITGVDAASCYDRIVQSIVILIARQAGFQLLTLITIFREIQNMQYYVRTGYGESEKFYGGKQEIPFQGTCQGNGGSPAYWLIVTMIMVGAMYKTGNITNLEFPVSKEKRLRNMGFIFVDDTDLITIGKEEETVEMVTRRQQEAASQWEKLLEITGGALKPSKCYWYLVHFKFNQGEWSYADTSNYKCKIRGEGAHPQFINGLAVDETREIMGVWQNLSGNNNRQIEGRQKEECWIYSKVKR